MRIVIDTNVLIAALANPSGNGAQVVNAWLEGRLDVVSSQATLREAELVLDSGWLTRMCSKKKVKALLEQLKTRTIQVRGCSVEDIALKDEGDRRLVEAAVDGDATYLVTTDRELLMQRGYAGTEFVTPAELLRVLS
jgi:putative PIN family toxin of toxin-antitoxin system